MSDGLYVASIVIGILSVFSFIGMNIGWFPEITDISYDYKAWLLQHKIYEPSAWARLNNK